jgi:uncharacterized lipoprotein YbaY
MNTAFAFLLRAAVTLGALCCFVSTSHAQAQPQVPARNADNGQDNGGISSPMISRCAGKFGSQLREGDQAFPLLAVLGFPWLKVESTDQTVNGVHVVAIVTGIGARNRRRGEYIGLSFRCLIDDKGDAVSFTWNDLLPERKEALPPAAAIRGSAYYRPRMQLPRGSELRVQLLDFARDPAGALLTETVVRSSWEEPIPFVFRVPPEVSLTGRKLAVAARLAVGSKTLYRPATQPVAVSADDLQKPLTLMLDATTVNPPQ